jgi:uncharacterized protein (TIGR02145 family)
MKLQLIIAAFFLLQSCDESTKSNAENTVEKVKIEKNKIAEKLNTDSSLKPKYAEVIKKKIIETHKQDFSEITIDKQVWMTNNLNVNKFRNGDIIKQVKSKKDWQKAKKNKEPAWCYYDNDSINGDKYGKIYNFYAVNDKRELAPKGWHIASKNEFWELRRNTQEDDLEGYKKEIEKYENEIEEYGVEVSAEDLADLKESLKQNIRKKDATISMFSKDAKIEGKRGTDLFGFNAMPGGYRDKYGNFKDLGKKANWKCATKNTREKTWGAYISVSYSDRYNAMKAGCYVRCIKN